MIEMDQIDKKAASSLEGYLVRKDLVRTFSRQFPVPTYVVEFLLGRYCASTEQAKAATGLEVPAAIAEYRKTLRDWPAKPTPARLHDSGAVGDRALPG